MNREELYEAYYNGDMLEHANRPLHAYILSDIVEVKKDGEWVEGIAYYEMNEAGRIYVRTVDNFQNFSVI